MKYKMATLTELNTISQLRSLRKSLTEISQLTGNSYSRITDLTYRYRLPNNRWTDEEIQFLIDNYKNYDCEELAKILNRSIFAIRTKKYLLRDKIKKKLKEKNNV